MKKSEKNTYSDRLSNRIQKIMNADKKDKIRWILFGAALICIVFSRVYQIQSVPGDINQDEAFSGYNAYTLAHSGKDSFGYRFPMYLTAWGSGMNAMHAYLSIPFVVLFGTNAWSLRIVPVLCAVLTLLAVYFIAKHYVNEYFALFLFFFAGIAPWHIMLSRWGLESNLAPAFLCFGLFFFLKGIEQEIFSVVSCVLWIIVIYLCDDLGSCSVHYRGSGTLPYFIKKDSFSCSNAPVSSYFVCIGIAGAAFSVGKSRKNRRNPSSVSFHTEAGSLSRK